MLGGQSYLTMAHTSSVYYSIRVLASAYQGKIMVPNTTLWEWHMGNTINSCNKFKEYHANVTNQGTLWTPGGNKGISEAIKMPNLLAIPNALVNLLCSKGPSITPHDALVRVDGFIESSGHPHGQQWEFIRQWCLVAGQSGPNGKSKVFLETTPVTINSKEFDHWVGQKLDITLGLWPAGATHSKKTSTSTSALDYLTLSKMLVTTIVTNML
jgi:hypothetical protein